MFLPARFRVLKSEGNFNNHFGLPLMLLKLEPEHDVAVIEMGMSHAGEIAALAKIAQPEIGVVTNVAPVHLEFFNSVADIARAKYELIESLPAHGTAILNADDEYVSQFGRDFRGKVVLYGLKAAADVRAENIEMRGAEGFGIRCGRGSCREKASVCRWWARTTSITRWRRSRWGWSAGLTPFRGGRARWLRWLPPTSAGRSSNWVTLRSSTIATIPIQRRWMPWWMRLAAMPAKRRIVVAGEMLELGPAGEELHRQSGEHIAAKKIDVLLGCAVRRKPWSKRLARQGCEPSLWPRPKKPASGWRGRRATEMWCC